MGIKFRCHVCQFPMNVKEFQAGKKSRCPKCDSRFRIPFVEQDFSIPLTANELAKDKGFNPIESEEAAVAVPKNQVVDAKPSKGFKVDSASWLIRIPSGEQFGPANDEVLLEWIRESRVTAECMLRKEGMNEWLPAPKLFPNHFPPPKPKLAPPPIPPNIPTSNQSGAEKDVLPKNDEQVSASDPANSGPSLESIRSSLENLRLAPTQQRALIKKNNKRRQQVRWIIGLSLLAVLLLIVLVVVIIWNPAARYGGGT